VAPRIAYLRGDRTQEQSNGGALRNRTSALGDIIDSAPAFVGAPPFLYRDSVETVPYSSFRLAQANRKQAVYVGANDGMLHAFSADSGQEYFAFVPGGVFNNLYKLTQPTYTHRYYVDSSPVPIDAFYASAWHTVLTSGLGAGGQSIFALEVTHPDAYTSISGTSPFMWEFTDATDKDLGYTFSRPLVVRLHNGQWAALFGNGYNNMVADGHASTTGDAVLYIVDVQTGTLIRKLDTNVGMLEDPTRQNRPNGLSSPTVVDSDSDTIVDYVYAGDLYGNLWKFDLSSNSKDSWGVAYSKPIFTAVNANAEATKQVQPITTKPSVSRGPNGVGLIITFGTGKYLETGDSILSNLVTQTFYGIFDPNTGNASSDVISDRSKLTPQTIVYEGSQQFTASDGTKSTTNVRAVSNTAVGSSRGWYLDLISPVNHFEGEMQVTDSVVDNGQVFFTTLIPNSDPCSGGGRSWLMVLNVFSGGRLDTAPFDLNADGNFNSSDYVTLSDGTKVPTSGLGLNDGIGSKPAILSSNDTATSINGGGSDLIVINSSNGTPTSLKKNPGPRVVGRQSWRQVR
jgi:type IV pilus assembly protein PilY1